MLSLPVFCPRKVYFLLVILLVSANFMYGQIQFQNPSFEGVAGQPGNAPAPWIICNGSTDTEPGVFCNAPASHGNTYLGFWDGAPLLMGMSVEGVPMGEGVMQRLAQGGNTCPLTVGKTYTFQVDVTANPSSSYNPGSICFVLGTAQCQPTRLVWRSDAASVIPSVDRTWRRYTISFVADQPYTWAGFYAINKTGSQQASIDNLSVILKDEGTVTVQNATCSTPGSATYTSAGAGPFQYTWYKVGNPVFLQQGPGNVINMLAPGNYTVEVRDLSESCAVPVIKSFTITGSALIKGNATTDKAIVCNGESAQLNFILNGVGNYNYSWSPSTGLSDPNIKNPTATPSADSTAYIITVTDPNDPTCELKDTVYIKKIKVNPGTDGTAVLCESDGPVDLFTKLGNSPETGGTWTDPTSGPFTNPLNPATATSGNYTYTVSKSGCPALSAKVTVTINKRVYAGTDSVVSQCKGDGPIDLASIITGEDPGGTWTGPGNLNSVTGILNASVLVPGVYNYHYAIKALNPCPIDSAKVTVTIRPVPTAVFQPISSICPGATTALPVTFTGDGPFTLTYRIAGGPAIVVPGMSNGSSIPINPLVTTTYEIISVSGLSDYCKNTNPSSVTVVVNQPPVLSVDNVICTPQNTGYNVHLSITGGDPGSYKINGNPHSGSTFVSAVLSPGSSYTFRVTDQYGCNPISEVTGNKSCACVTDAGTMEKTPVKVCGATPASGIHKGDQKKDPNDVIVYVLHDSPGITLGNIIEVNRNAPTFVYDPEWQIQYGQPYYISAVAGDPAPGDPTMVDLSDPNGCLSVSAGQPVIFNELPYVSAALSKTKICAGETTDIIFTFLAGREDFDLDYKDAISSLAIAGRTYVNNTFTLTPPDIGANTYVLTRITDVNGCTSALNIPLTVLVTDKPVANSLTTLCNSTNTAYTVTFNIAQGDPASYTVNGAPSSSVYTSALIPSGTPYLFTVSDANNCQPPTVVSGTETCPCITKAGSMAAAGTATPLEFCIYSPATALHNGDQVTDGNDVLSFILCSDPLDPAGSMIKVNKVPSFSFMLPLTAGTIYYICPVAGDDDGFGFADLNAACRDIGAGVPVRFIDLPTVAITGDAEICSSTSTPITFNVKGSGPVKFNLLGSDGSFLAVSGLAGVPFIRTVTPSINTGTVIYRIDTVGAAGVYDSTSPAACRGSWISAPVAVQVNPSPTASFISPDVFTLCDGESILLNLATTGDGNIWVDVRDDVDNTIFSFNQPASSLIKKLVTPAGVGKHNYIITAVSSVSAAGITCNGIFSDTATIEVRPLPAGTISASPADICLGQPAILKLTPSGNFVPYRFVYRDNISSAVNKMNVYGADTTLFRTPSQDVVYTLDSVYDGTISSATGKACASAVNSQASIIVRPLPAGHITGSREICFGDTAELVFDFTGSAANAADYTAVYRDVLANSAPLSVVSSGNIYTVLVSPGDTVRYELVKVYDRFGCEAASLSGAAYIPVNPIPVPIVAATDTSSCPPLVTTLINLTDPANVGSYQWHFGDDYNIAVNGTGTTYNRVYDTPGSYTIRLEVTSPAGCYKDTVLPDFLTVHPFPVADFNWSPNPATFTNTFVTFSDLSVDASAWQWQFSSVTGDLLGVDSRANPRFEFPSADTGSYPVNLIVNSSFGCADTITRTVYIGGELIVYIPNSFTPNDDGVNDVFLPVITGLELDEYEFWVFDRWGEKMFYSTDPEKGWDGTFKGVKVKNDVYTFRVRVRSAYTAYKDELRGKVNVLR